MAFPGVLYMLSVLTTIVLPLCLMHFLEGLVAYGTSTRVRSDHGGENIDVWRHMLSLYNDPTCV